MKTLPGWPWRFARSFRMTATASLSTAPERLRVSAGSGKLPSGTARFTSSYIHTPCVQLRLFSSVRTCEQRGPPALLSSRARGGRQSECCSNETLTRIENRPLHTYVRSVEIGCLRCCSGTASDARREMGKHGVSWLVERHSVSSRQMLDRRLLVAGGTSFSTQSCAWERSPDPCPLWSVEACHCTCFLCLSEDYGPPM